MRRLLVGLVGVLALGAHGFNVVAQETVTGHWVGVASRQGADLALDLDFEQTGRGLQGFITAKTLAGLSIPLTNIAFDSGSLRFDLPTDNSTFSFAGTVRGTSLTGSWNLFGFESQISMTRAVAGPAPYDRQDVSCRNGDVTLAGTVFMPVSSGARLPAVVFVHGSGPGPRQAFNFLADHFARLGIAALVFDKRGSGSSTGDWRQADFGDLARDVLACVGRLRDRGDIDVNRLGLVGQSQGGWVAPLAASMSPDVSFMILISGPAVTVARQGWWSTEFRLRDRGFGVGDIDEARALWQMDDEVTRTGLGLVELQTAIERVKGKPWFAAVPFNGTPEPARSFYRRIIDFDPSPVLEGVAIPSLWMYGTRDENVPVTESIAVLNALTRSGKDVAVREFPGANHAMWVGPQEGGPFRWPGLAPGYLDTMNDWLQDHVQPRR